MDLLYFFLIHGSPAHVKRAAALLKEREPRMAVKERPLPTELAAYKDSYAECQAWMWGGEPEEIRDHIEFLLPEGAELTVTKLGSGGRERIYPAP